jgi:preprotein translocase subunit YajC
MGMNSIVLLVVMVVVFYGLLILPQRRNQKKRATMMSQLGPGAKILTTSGVFGQIVAMRDDVMVVKIAQGVEVEMDPRAVMRVVEAPTAQVVEPEA